MIRRFIAEESGATAIEYALIAALLSVAIVGSLTMLGGEYEKMYATIERVLTENTPDPK